MSTDTEIVSTILSRLDSIYPDKDNKTLATKIGKYIFNKTDVTIPTKHLNDPDINYKDVDEAVLQSGKIYLGTTYLLFVVNGEKSGHSIAPQFYKFIQEVIKGGTRKNKGKSRKNKNKSKKMNRKSNKRR